jgi:hypothetical protein
MSLLDDLKSKYKGWDGELTVKLMQWFYLDKKTYHVFNNVILPNFGGGTTQIDHIIVSVYGIFVVETKNMNGWIYGSEKDSKWTQVFFNKKYSFQNPLRQNYKHIKTISEILKISEINFTLLSCSSVNVNSKQKCPKTCFSRVTPNTLKAKLKKSLQKNKSPTSLKALQLTNYLPALKQKENTLTT